MGCVFNYKGLTFKSEKDLDDYILGNSLGVRFSGKTLADQKEIVEALKKNHAAIDFDEEIHEYSRKVNGEKEILVPTSTIVSAMYPWKGPAGDESAENPTRDAGSYFHWMADLALKNLSEGKDHMFGIDLKKNSYKYIDDVHKSELEVPAIKWLTYLADLYDTTLNPKVPGTNRRENVVLSEIRTASTLPVNVLGIEAPHGIGGTLDIVVVTPEGIVHTYDHKFSLHEYTEANKGAVESDKARSNNLQQSIYREFLRRGDANLDMPSLSVDKSHLIFVKLDFEGDVTKRLGKDGKPLKDSKGNEIKTISDLSKPMIIDIDDAKFFGSLSTVHKAWVGTSIPLDKSVADVVGGIEVKGSLNISSLGRLTGLGTTVDNSSKARANRTYVRNYNGKHSYNDIAGLNVMFKDSTALTDTSKAGDAARLRELEKYYDTIPDTGSDNVGQDFAQYINFGQSSFIKTSRKDFTGNDKTSQRKLQLDRLKAGLTDTDFAVAANTLKGFENFGSDAVIVFRDYDPNDKSFASAILYSVVDGESVKEDTIDKSVNTRELKNIFGNSVPLHTVKNAIVKEGVQTIRLYDRTNRNDRFMKLGIMAMKLKETYPDIKIGNVVVGSHTNYETHNPYVSDSLSNIFKHLKVLRSLKTEGGLAIKDFPQEFKDLLAKDDLLIPEDYHQNEVSFLISYLANAHQSGVEIEHGVPLREGRPKVDVSDINPKVVSFMGEGFVKRVFGNIDAMSPKQVRDLTEKLVNDDTKKDDVIGLLNVLQRRLMGEEVKSEAYMNTYEYKLLANAIAHYHGIRNDTENAQDIGGLRETYASLAGMTGVGIVDQYIQRMKIASRMIENEFKNSYLSKKEAIFTKIYGLDNVGNKARNYILGDTTTKFEPLLEKQSFKVLGSEKEEKRFTGRFWKKGSAEYNALDSVQKEFIETFNAEVKKNLLRNANPEQVKNFEDYWEEGWIPLLKSSMNNMEYKMWHDTGTGESFLSKLKATTDRWFSQYKNYESSFEAMTHNSRDIPDFFKLKGKASKSIETRYKRIGLVRNERSEWVIDPTEKSYVETNLERVLDTLTANSIKVQENRKLIPLYHAVRQGLIASGHIYNNRNDYKNTLKYLDVAVKGSLFDEHQVGDPNLEKTLVVLGGVAASSMVSFRLSSAIKNMIAGHFMTFGEELAKAYGRGDAAGLKAYGKAYVNAFNLINSSDGSKGALFHDIMSSMNLADQDVEKLSGDGRFKVGTKHFSQFGSIAHTAGDYFHRAVMVGARMEIDGTIKAYKKVGDTWEYDETLDSRFNGEDGKKRLAETKEIMAKQGLLRENGTMKVPYTMEQSMELKHRANMLFFSMDKVDQALYKQWAIGRTFGSMNGWLASKLDKWLTRGQVNPHYSQQRTKEIMHEDGTSHTVTYHNEDGYFEGMWYTLKDLGMQLHDSVKDKDMEGFAEYWKNLHPDQRGAVMQAAYSVAIIGGLSAIVASMFSKPEDKKTMAFNMLSGSLDESYLIAQAQAMYKLTASPFPMLSVARNTYSGLHQLWKDDGDANSKGWRAVSSFLGPFKMGTDIQRYVSEENK